MTANIWRHVIALWKIGDSAFSVVVPRVWNWLPTYLKLEHLTASFKWNPKTFSSEHHIINNTN